MNDGPTREQLDAIVAAGRSPMHDPAQADLHATGNPAASPSDQTGAGGEERYYLTQEEIRDRLTMLDTARQTEGACICAACEDFVRERPDAATLLAHSMRNLRVALAASRATITRLEGERDEARKPAMCSVCAGRGRPLSGKPCICGGVGTEQAELQGFREECRPRLVPHRYHHHRRNLTNDDT